jgi:hypothetical protein
MVAKGSGVESSFATATTKCFSAMSVGISRSTIAWFEQPSATRDEEPFAGREWGWPPSTAELLISRCTSVLATSDYHGRDLCLRGLLPNL